MIVLNLVLDAKNIRCPSFDTDHQFIPANLSGLLIGLISLNEFIEIRLRFKMAKKLKEKNPNILD